MARRALLVAVLALALAALGSAPALAITSVGGVAPPTDEPTTHAKPWAGWVFPIRGAHDFGGSGSRFGAGRSGHIHQGQDVSAPEGTKLVSVHSGTVRFVDYQASGAGYYVVIHDSEGRYEFAYMHLKRGSTAVRLGQHVRAGQRIGRVGHTGAASGSHLHFEVWVGPWQTGGHPIDPLPYLKRWDR